MNINIKDCFKHLSETYFPICSFILIGTLIFLTVFQINTISTSLLFQIIIVSFFAALLGLVLKSNNETMSKKQYLIRIIVHFILVNLLMALSAYMFSWIYFDNIPQIILYEILVIIVYALVWLSIYYINYSCLRELNKKLLEYKKNRNDGNE